MRIILGLNIITLLFNIAVFPEDSFSKTMGLEEDLYSIAISPFNNNLIFVGSNSSIYKSTDSGKIFQRILVVQGDSKKVNQIIFNPQHYQGLFFATDSGLYISNDLGETSFKVFKTKGEEGNYIRCLSLVKLRKAIYLGTSNGLYIGKENIYDFRRIRAIPRDTAVYDIKVNFADESIILATSKGVYRGREDKDDFERTFVSKVIEESSLSSAEDEREIIRNIPQCIYIEEENPSVIYLGTSSGMFESQDSGRTWRKIHILGLEGLDIRRAEKDPIGLEVFYLATDKGFYALTLNKNILRNIYSGLASQDIRDMALQKEKGQIFLATSSGLYKSSNINSGPTDINDDKNRLNFEPTYMEVQEATLDYNDIHPDKTRRWRNALKYRGLVPRVSLDYDKTVNYDGGADRYYTGPFDWGISVSWDFADLIWNSYQDDIDTRIRLNTQTRLDILDEVRRLYFERKKIKSELLRNPLKDKGKLREKQLYLEELTAALDGYTGGYFSKRIRQLQESNQQ